jgi:hypothetical protein
MAPTDAQVSETANITFLHLLSMPDREAILQSTKASTAGIRLAARNR